MPPWTATHRQILIARWHIGQRSELPLLLHGKCSSRCCCRRPSTGIGGRGPILAVLTAAGTWLYPQEHVVA